VYYKTQLNQWFERFLEFVKEVKKMVVKVKDINYNYIVENYSKMLYSGGASL